MTQLTRFRLEDGSSVVVEVAEEEGFTRAGRTDRVVDAVGESFEQALQKVQHAASAALDLPALVSHPPALVSHLPALVSHVRQPESHVRPVRRHLSPR
ncbi:hypothetical protein FNH05_34295 [Amycolatopsis rhizosphaerae]|uniref:Trypsin-co-occurring domain-containing protein n=1 Tax=Amycolatopsis rhizosphaerae TaxID=2053003 RepID=A0A558A951_9PSEU|nr:hypothetical protein [Amycolatopsis rhizosphaerae]TVT20783.1 hypothetical protein FNH05_34295 [Amycolatopsis rhizosphaerae]